jgi:hypothetical protein
MDKLRVLAETDGFFTRTDALSVGHDDKSIRRALKVRLWTRIRAGAYTFPDLWPESIELRHDITSRAVARKLGRDVALSHTSSAIEHGLRLWDADLELVHVTRLDAGAGRTESGVVHHVGLTLDSDLVEKRGALITGVARAAIETASLVTTESGLVTLDSALESGRCTREDLSATFELMQCWPGLQRVQVAVRLADGGAQSVGESRTRYLCYVRGLPAPILQYEVFDATGRLVGISDFAWPDPGVLGEFDGRVKYGRLLREGEEPGDAVFREKVREDRLREATGWPVIRITWADLHRPDATAARIRRLLRVAA